jgi:hypothetical protein
MKIAILNLPRLRNEEHFQFHTDFKNLTESSNPASLGIAETFENYLVQHGNEKEALDVIRKSAVTDDIAEADALRDDIYKGLRDAMKAAGRHFLPEKQQAATRIQVVLDHYNGLSIKPYDEETAAITSMIAELATHAADITLLGLSDWVSELQANNEAFDSLKKARYSEIASKTQLRMKQTRVAADDAYTRVTERINALAIVNGDAAYAAYINELNQRIASYSNLLAQRKGRNAKDDSVTLPPAV